MAISSPLAGREPLGEMNMTPLIDVLLVLLVMMVLTVPIATHSLPVDLPREGPPGADRVKNALVLHDNGSLEWNGRMVSDRQLAGLLGQVRAMAPEPEVRFEPDPDVSYARSAQVLLMIKQSRVSNFGFVGNERYRTFSR